MNVIFICSGNAATGISPILIKQAESLMPLGTHVSFYAIKKRGAAGYLKNIISIRNKLKKEKFDLIHAHFSFSAFVATLAFSGLPMIVSLMGSDLLLYRKTIPLIRFFKSLFWKAVIVKSLEMNNILNVQNSFIIPNGVDISIFKPLDKTVSKERVGFEMNLKHIIFLANLERKEKNYLLAAKAVEVLDEKNVRFHVIKNKSIEDIPYYMNAADVLLLTSLHEGSPNVVKEAMACNLPVVCVNVGDVSELFGNIPGYFISKNDPQHLAINLKKSLIFGKTEGRRRIVELGLDSISIAKKIVGLYEDVLR